jgi:MoaA/NifB/PqqE/SkfB family radical SAM enzyme
VALVGGEPLLLPENERLLDVIPESAIVTLITNLNVDLQNNKIFRRLAERKRVGWSMSFDNIADRFEYVRYGGSWTLIEKNIQKLKALRTLGHQAGIHAVYNVYNATRLMELRMWAQDQRIDITWQSLYQPEYLDPLRLGDEIKQLAYTELVQVLAQTNLTVGERGFFAQAEKNYIEAAHPSLLPQLKNHITEIESVYHTDQQSKFVQLWPELNTI